MKEVLKLAREFIDDVYAGEWHGPIIRREQVLEAIDKALAQQSVTCVSNEQVEPKFKLMPREATREMLEAMDACSIEGYDERLYAGHAGSVYMAAWDAFTHPPVPTTQPEPLDTPLPCDVKVGHVTIRKGVALSVLIARMQVLYDMAQPKEPEQEQSGFFSREAMKAHSDFHVAQPEQEPVAIHQVFIDAGWQDKNESDLWMYGDEHCWQKRIVYTTPPQRKPLPHSVMVKHMKESCDSMEMRGAFADGWMSAEAAHGIKGD